MKKRKLLNQIQAAELLGVSVNRLAGWLDRGLVPFVKIGRVRKVDRDALVEWYEAQIVRPEVATNANPDHTNQSGGNDE